VKTNSSSAFSSSQHHLFSASPSPSLAPPSLFIFLFLPLPSCPQTSSHFRLPFHLLHLSPGRREKLVVEEIHPSQTVSLSKHCDFFIYNLASCLSVIFGATSIHPKIRYLVICQVRHQSVSGSKPNWFTS
jgi:hypothetical protein